MLLLTGFSACGQPESLTTESVGEIKIDEVASGLDHPWGIDFLPDGRLLVTERSGSLRILDLPNNNKLSEPVPGTPKVFASGQGGLLDVAIDPDFESNQMVWFTFSEPGPNGTASAALGRGKLQDNRINNFEVIFRQDEKVNSGHHFGSRIVFTPDGKIFVTFGDRGQKTPAQDLSNYIGTIVRINRDGSVPADNPFANSDTAQPAIYSYGHRNIQSAAIDPATGQLWVAEMGPRHGDELNRPQPGKNYGWPLVSWGEEYNGTPIPDPPTRPDLEDAVMQWTPVISPSGMQFYTGSMFTNWQGHMLIGGLSSQALVIVRVNGSQAEEAERLNMRTRIRDVKEAPDGSIYLITDESNGTVLRLSR